MGGGVGGKVGSYVGELVGEYVVTPGVGLCVGRPGRGVGARVLLVPAWAPQKRPLMTRKAKMVIDFIVFNFVGWSCRRCCRSYCRVMCGTP